MAVKAETTFVFLFRLSPLPEGELNRTRDPLTKQVAGWLETALKTWEPGAKTATGPRLRPELRFRFAPERRKLKQPAPE